jgi:membrane protease YdiL (CAAX protease family)
MMVAIIYLLALSGAEAVTVFVSPIWGILLHLAVFLALIVHSSVNIGYHHRRLLLSLTLAPLVRIISLSMPLENIPQIYRYPIIYTPLLLASLVVIRLLNLHAGQVGLVLKKIPLQLAILLMGIPLGILEYLLLRPDAIVDSLTWQDACLPAIILVLGTGFIEELIFRGVLQRTVVESFGKPGIIYVGLLFAMLHMGYLLWTEVAFVFLVALFFGWVVHKTGSLLGVSLAHGTINVMLYIVIPFFPSLVPR